MDGEALNLKAPQHTAKSQPVPGAGAITERPTQANPALLGDGVLVRIQESLQTPGLGTLQSEPQAHKTTKGELKPALFSFYQLLREITREFCGQGNSSLPSGNSEQGELNIPEESQSRVVRWPLFLGNGSRESISWES